jgi:hypothetical protein
MKISSHEDRTIIPLGFSPLYARINIIDATVIVLRALSIDCNLGDRRTGK